MLIKKFLLLSIMLATFISIFSSTFERDLKRAVENNCTFTVQSIFEALSKLKAKINLDSQDKDGDTLLHAAVGWNNKNVVNLLLQNGANPNVQNKVGETPFFNENDPEMVSIFVKYGANGDIANKTGINALQRAVSLELTEIAKLFVQARAKVNSVYSNGDTLLMKAIITGNNELVKLLLDFDARAFIKNKEGEIALQFISSYYTRTLFCSHPNYIIQHHNHFRTLYSGYPAPMLLNGEIDEKKLKQLNEEIEFLQKNSKIKMENNRNWLEQNLYDYFLVNETINKIEYPWLKPRKFCHLNRHELLTLRNDLINSIRKLKSLLSKFSYDTSFQKALKDIGTSLDLHAGSIGADII